MTKRLIAASLALGALAFWQFAPRPDSTSQGEPSALPRQDPVAIAPVSIEPASAPAAVVGPIAYGPEERMRDMLQELRAAFRFGKLRQNALRGILDQLTQDEILAALDQTFPSESDNDITHVLIEHIAGMDASAALDFARTHHFGESPPWWMSVIGGLENPQEAMTDLMVLPPGDARTSFLTYMTGRWALSDPDAALEYAVYEAPLEVQQIATSNAVLFAAHNNPGHAFNLALTLAPATEEVSLLAQVATEWAASDYSQAHERIQQLPAGAAKQSALAGLVAVAISRDLPRALPMITELEDPSIRSDFYVQAARQWLAQDGVAARNWLADTSVLSPEQKASLLQESGRMGPVSIH